MQRCEHHAADQLPRIAPHLRELGSDEWRPAARRRQGTSATPIRGWCRNTTDTWRRPTSPTKSARPHRGLASRPIRKLDRLAYRNEPAKPTAWRYREEATPRGDSITMEFSTDIETVKTLMREGRIIEEKEIWNLAQKHRVPVNAVGVASLTWTLNAIKGDGPCRRTPERRRPSRRTPEKRRPSRIRRVFGPPSSAC